MPSGEWLGFRDRRRAQQVAIINGEAQAALEPLVPECDFTLASASNPKG